MTYDRRRADTSTYWSFGHQLVSPCCGRHCGVTPRARHSRAPLFSFLELPMTVALERQGSRRADCARLRQLPNTIVLQPMTATLEIENTWDCGHHLLGYIALMDPTALPAAYSPQNQRYLSWIVSRIE